MFLLRWTQPDFRVTQMYLDLAGVDFAEEAERAAARAFAHVPRAQVRAQAANTSPSVERKRVV
jgi:hypothetical protein